MSNFSKFFQIGKPNFRCVVEETKLKPDSKKEDTEFNNKAIDEAQQVLTEVVSADSRVGDVLDSMSLRFGSIKASEKVHQRQREARLRRTSQALLSLSEAQETSPDFHQLVNRLQKVPIHNLLEEMQVENLQPAAMILALSALTRRYAEGSLQLKQVQALLNTIMMEQKGWTIDLFSVLELGAVKTKDMGDLRYLHYLAQEECGVDHGLAAWFSHIQQWPNRRNRLRVLSRAWGANLSSYIREEARLVETLANTKRLQAFFQFEDDSIAIEKHFNLHPDAVLKEALILLDPPVLDSQWLQERILAMGVVPEEVPYVISNLHCMFRDLPEICFMNNAHRQSILRVLEEINEEEFANQPLAFSFLADRKSKFKLC